MKMLMTGSSGLVGSFLVEYLFLRAHSIYCLQRNRDPASSPFWAIDTLTKNSDCLFQAVIHLPGENVPEGKWTEEKKQLLLTSGLEGTSKLIDYIATLDVKPSVFLGGSAVGFYGNRGDEIVDENSSTGEGFLADVCRRWEEETQRLVSMGIRVVNLRFGLILSPRGRVLLPIIPPFQTRSSDLIGSGKQYISWISIRDLVAIVDFIIQHDHVHGPVNVVSPIQTTTSGLTRALGKALNRPAIFSLPVNIIRLIFGRMADETLLGRCRVRPRILLESGYEFKDQSLDDVLRSFFNK